MNLSEDLGQDDDPLVAGDKISNKNSSQDDKSKKFVYLLQTEECIPDPLRDLHALGNPEECLCDVIVLSFKKKCTVTPPKHIEYLYDPSSTWTTGRNMLYEASKKKKRNYLYYFIMDDDVVLKSKTNKPGNPWRKFENFLERIEPAVAIADGSHVQRAPIAFKQRQNLKCPGPPFDEQKTEYVPSPRWEACLNAFHRDAVDHVLPYTTVFDKISWWVSVVYMESKCEVVFPGQVVIHTDILAMNGKHRPYKRHAANAKEYGLIIDEVAKNIPKKYRNAKMLQEMRKHGFNMHAYASSTFCLPLLSPHEPIIPFRLTAL